MWLSGLFIYGYTWKKSTWNKYYIYLYKLCGNQHTEHIWTDIHVRSNDLNAKVIFVEHIFMFSIDILGMFYAGITQSFAIQMT